MSRLLALAACAAAVTTLVVAVPGSAQKATPDPALERSHALASAAATGPLGPAPTIPAATARVIADDVARQIPLPVGGTFSGVRWEEAGGVFSRSEIAAVLQYNAVCQWLRAWRDGRQSATSSGVLADVPSWPGWRGGETGAVLTGVVADVRAGGGPASAAMLGECDAAREREVAYATARAMTPTR